MAITNKTRNRRAAETYAQTFRSPEPHTVLVDLETGRIIPPQPALKVATARGFRWHVDKCPGCGRQHSHRALGVVRAPCGAEYAIEAWWKL